MLFTLVTVMEEDVGAKGWRVCSKVTLNATTKSTAMYKEILVSAVLEH
jgi:hypothetical protein